MFSGSIDNEVNLIVVLFLELIHFVDKAWQVLDLDVWLYVWLSILGKVTKQNSLDVDDLSNFIVEVLEETLEHGFKVGTVLLGGQTIMKNSHIFVVP